MEVGPEVQSRNRPYVGDAGRAREKEEAGAGQASWAWCKLVGLVGLLACAGPGLVCYFRLLWARKRRPNGPQVHNNKMQIKIKMKIRIILNTNNI